MAHTLTDIQNKYGRGVYPLYKDTMHEPYMEGDNGIGYKGVILWNEEKDKIQCGECGKWFKELASHIHFTHKINGEQYKEKFGLYIKTPLCSKSVSQQKSELAVKNMSNRDWESIRYKKGVGKGARKRLSLVDQHNNTYGLCEAQIAARLMIVREMSGKSNISDITSTDISKYDHSLATAISHKFGNYKNASEVLGIKFIGERKHTPFSLIAQLRNFVKEFEFIPLPKQFSEYGLPAFGTYVINFGSWRKAKMMAGLDQLLAEVKTSTS